MDGEDALIGVQQSGHVESDLYAPATVKLHQLLPQVSGNWNMDSFLFFFLNKKKKLGPLTFSCKEEWRQQESENADGREIS